MYAECKKKNNNLVPFLSFHKILFIPLYIHRTSKKPQNVYAELWSTLSIAWKLLTSKIIPLHTAYAYNMHDSTKAKPFT